MKLYKMNTRIRFSAILIVTLLLTFGCENELNEIAHSQFAADNFLATEGGSEKLLDAVYAGMQWHRFQPQQVNYLEEGTTDLFFETGGGQHKWAKPLQEWTWDSGHNWTRQIFQIFWPVIRDVNAFLDNIDKVEYTQADKNVRIAEARFIRAFQYYRLTKWFGDVPLLTSPLDELYPSRTPVAEIHTFIEAELLAAATDLPTNQSEYGRITKGAAYSLLAKHYLNTKQWQKSAETTLTVMNLGVYSLYPNYPDMFKPENEVNSEYIFVFPNMRMEGLGSAHMATARPSKYPISENQSNFGAQYRYYDAFVNSFDLNDDRRTLFLTEYTDTKGVFKQLLGKNDSRSFKFDDDDSLGQDQDNDLPILRYADILLSRAETLNEISGPNQESIDLINEVRIRANVSPITLSFSKESLRDHILAERGWEFYSESKRRTDLIRHGKFIQQAVDRGLPGDNFRLLYPIPIIELDKNPNLTQNNGY